MTDHESYIVFMAVRLSFGEWLEDQLRTRGWTQSAFAAAAGSGWIETGLVIDRGDGERLSVNAYNLAFHRTRTRLDLPRIRPHDLRHGAATLMLSDAGLPMLVVSRIIGHAGIGTTADTYGTCRSTCSWKPRVGSNRPCGAHPRAEGTKWAPISVPCLEFPCLHAESDSEGGRSGFGERSETLGSVRQPIAAPPEFPRLNEVFVSVACVGIPAWVRKLSASRNLRAPKGHQEKGRADGVTRRPFEVGGEVGRE